MDVRCDRCQTEYEFDENYLTPNGVAVKCTTCGNVFKVRRSATQPLIVSTPVPTSSPSSSSIPGGGAPAGMSLSLVRWRAGQTLPLKDLMELQRWVVERKVAREDEVSFGGEGFRKLGSLPELNSFFQLVDAADRAQQQATSTTPPPGRVEPRPAVPPALINTTPGFPEAPKALGSAPLLTPEPAWTGQRRATSPMNMATLVDEELDGDDLSRIRGTRIGIWLLALILVGGGGGGAWWYLNNSGPLKPTFKPHSPLPAAVPEPAPDASSPTGATPTSTSPTGATPTSTSPAAATPQAIPPVAPGVPGTPEPGAPDAAVSPVAPAAAPISPAASVPPGAAPDAAVPPGPGVHPGAVALPATTATPTAAPAAAPAPAAVPGMKTAAEIPATKPAAEPPTAPIPPNAVPPKTDFAGYMARGRRLIETRPVEALEMFKKASQLVPSSPEPYAARGLAYTDMQAWDLAIESFNGALSRNPNFSDAVMGLAEAYRYKGDKLKAQINYQRYLEMAPSGPDARVARVQLEILKGTTPPPQ